MSIFEAVKQSVTTRQAAERYGTRVERNGMCRCPFHDDSTPSMKLDRRYYCFGCGATGDVIDFVSRLRGIGSKEAAILLAQDFAIPYEQAATTKYGRTELSAHGTLLFPCAVGLLPAVMPLEGGYPANAGGWL